MSHELRTPLNAIIGFSEMLTNKTADAARCSPPRANTPIAVNEVRQSPAVGRQRHPRYDEARHRRFRDPARAIPARRRDRLAGCRDLLALKARESGIELVADVQADLPEIVADKRAVKQILINLLSNAIKFTDRGGCVKIHRRRPRATLAIAVEDNGIGIGEDDLPRIGKPFFQARGSYDRRHDGTGLGLSIVKGLVALHGGDVAIRSRVGEGTGIHGAVAARLRGRRGRQATSAGRPTTWTMSMKTTLRAATAAAPATLRAKPSRPVVKKSALVLP